MPAVLLLLTFGAALATDAQVDAAQRTVELQTSGGVVESAAWMKELASVRSMAVGDKALMADVSKHQDAAVPLIRRQAPLADTQAIPVVALEEESREDDEKAIADENAKPAGNDKDASDFASFGTAAMTKLGGGHIAWKVKNDKCLSRDPTTFKLKVESCASYYDQLWYWDEHWRLHNEEDGQDKCVKVLTDSTNHHLKMEDCESTDTQQFIFGRRRDHHKVSLLSAHGTDKCWEEVNDGTDSEIHVKACDDNVNQKFHFTDRRRSFHRRRRAGWDQQGDDALDEQEAGSTHANINYGANGEEHTGSTGYEDIDDNQGKSHTLTTHSNGNTHVDSNTDFNVRELPEGGGL